MVTCSAPNHWHHANNSPQSRDSSRTHLHLHHASHADLFEEFTRSPLLPDTIYLAPQHQPINPEDEDDVVPDQHAAFGIARATREKKEDVWRDLRLGELVTGHEGDVRDGRGTANGTSVSGSSIAVNGSGIGGQPTIGPARGVVRVPVGVRQGMRSLGSGAGTGTGSSLRG